MDCTTMRRACSALLDGEEADASTESLRTHLARCPSCRAFVRDAEAMRRDLGRPSPSPDMTAMVLSAARQVEHPRRADVMILRLGLVVVGCLQLVYAVPTLVFGADEGAPVHIAHELGAWDLALAVAFVFAAWRPLRAVGLLPFAATLSAGLICTAVVDVLNGRAVALTETTHLLELLGTLLLWLLVAPRWSKRAILRGV